MKYWIMSVLCIPVEYICAILAADNLVGRDGEWAWVWYFLFGAAFAIPGALACGHWAKEDK